jgi:alkylhydroperoxidase/carboxymuconolactone decarboxylase family protein YurZ
MNIVITIAGTALTWRARALLTLALLVCARRGDWKTASEVWRYLRTHAAQPKSAPAAIKDNKDSLCRVM